MEQPEKPKNCIFFTRRFLNRPGFDSVGAIYAKIDKDGYTELKIADCHRDINFDLTPYTSDGGDEFFKNTLFKLSLMESTIRNLRLALIKKAKKDGWEG